MKKMIFTALSLLLAANLAWADCATDAATKKLAGAAKSSFMKKCEADSKTAPVAAAAPAPAAAAPAAPAADDAKAKCEAKASEKKLRGAAKNSFVKKCEKDATVAK